MRFASNIRFSIRVTLIGLIAAGCSAAFSQTLAQVKTFFDARDFANAATQAQAVLNSGAESERPEAAAFLVRSYENEGLHQQVLSSYDACLTASRGTIFEPQCMLERAKSYAYNAKDTTTALQLYVEIVSAYPSDSFSAAGALYETGYMQANKLKLPTSALTTLNSVLNQFPESPFADDALVAKARLAVPLQDLSVLDEATSALDTINASPAIRQKVQFERGEYDQKVRGPAAFHDATYNYLAAAAIPGVENTEAAAMAKLRAADNFPNGDFHQSLALYRDVLNNYPKIARDLREWAACEEAVMLYQLKDEAGARAAAALTLQGHTTRRRAAQARLLIDAIDHPDSTSALVALYERAIRADRTQCRYDEVYWDMERVMGMADSESYRSYIADESINKEDRADMMYRMVFAYFHSNYGKKAYALADDCLKQLNPQAPGRARHHCLYMQAYLLGRAGQWSDAVPIWSKIIDENPGYDLLRNVYLEYSRALDFNNDQLGAAMAIEELNIRYPKSYESEMSEVRKQYWRRVAPQLQARVQEERPALVAKLDARHLAHPATAAEIAEAGQLDLGSPGRMASNVPSPAGNPKGGAE